MAVACLFLPQQAGFANGARSDRKVFDSEKRMGNMLEISPLQKLVPGL
jgi:hypothetical protein